MAYSSSDEDDLPSFDILSKRDTPHRTTLSRETCGGVSSSLRLGQMIPATPEHVYGGARKRPHYDPVIVLDDPVEQKRKQALERRKLKEKEKLERARLKREQAEEKKQQKQVDKAVKAAARAVSKENRPGERLKRMVVVLDRTLSENTDFMAGFAASVSSMDVEYRISTNEDPGVVRWRRIVTERGMDIQDAQVVVGRVTEDDESELLVTLEAQGFVGLVHHSKQGLLGNPVPSGALSLEQYIDKIYADNPGMRISLAVEGMESFFRGHKTRVNRQFRQAVLDSASGGSEGGSHASNRGKKKVPSADMFGDVSRLECEEALVRVQLRNCCVCRMCEDGHELAAYVVSLTKALCDAHYKKDYPFSFYVDTGQGPSKKELESTDNRVSLIWKHQLMQFNNMSSNMADAVVTEYSSPSHLLQAYERCTDLNEAQSLLKDILVRRGVGVVSSSRKLGPVQSKRIHTMMTSSDPERVLD